MTHMTVRYNQMLKICKYLPLIYWNILQKREGQDRRRERQESRQTKLLKGICVLLIFDGTVMWVIQLKHMLSNYWNDG